MKDFFRTLLASLAALVLFIGGSLGLVMAVGFAVGGGKTTVTPRSVLVLNLSTSFPETVEEPDPAGLVQRAMGGAAESALPLVGVLQALDRAAQDPDISALYLTGQVETQGYGSGPAALKELREAILRFKAAGKKVIAYNAMWSRREYYLCAGASELYLHPSGEVDCTGLSAEPMFFARAFRKYGVEVQVTRVGRYKSAVEPFILDRMSDANREQLTSLLGDVWGDWKASVAEDRKLSTDAVQDLSDRYGVLSAREALQARLVDGLRAPDQVLDELKELTGRQASDPDFPQVDLGTYMRMPAPAQGRNRVALVFAEGDIVDGHGREGQVGGDRLSRDLRQLRLDPSVKAIVLRVNSPGGSALASELIQREIILARKANKPVVVSMGHMAASGGYWISTYGDRIFAEPNTITGSIGVFGMLPNVRKLANDHGITWDSVQTSKLADVTTLARPKTPAELARIQALVDDVYDQFLTRVAASRNLPRERVEAIAQGRVWSGRQAQKLGLVDELGGLEDAIRYAARKAGVENDYRVDQPSGPLSPLERLLRMFGDDEKHRISQAATGPVAELRSRFDQLLSTFQALNDPHGVYARLPFDLNFR